MSEVTVPAKGYPYPARRIDMLHAAPFWLQVRLMHWAGAFGPVHPWHGKRPSLREFTDRATVLSRQFNRLAWFLITCGAAMVGAVLLRHLP